MPRPNRPDCAHLRVVTVVERHADVEVGVPEAEAVAGGAEQGEPRRREAVVADVGLDATQQVLTLPVLLGRRRPVACRAHGGRQKNHSTSGILSRLNPFELPECIWFNECKEI